MRVELEIDLASDPIAGRVAVPGGESRPFVGYTGLIAAIERIREADGLKQAVSGPTATVTTDPAERGT